MSMPLGLQLLKAALVGNFVLGLTFIYYLVNNLERRATKSLVVTFVGLLLWVLADAIQLWTPANPSPIVGTQLRILGPDITIIGLVLFAFEYTGRENLIDKRVLALLSIKPIISLVVVLTPALAGAVKFATPDAITRGYEFVPTPFYFGHITYSWILTGLAVAILARMMVKQEHGNDRQLFALFAAILIPLAVNISLHLRIFQFDLTTAAFSVTASALMYATLKLRLLDALPIARRTVLEEMDDLVFLLDEAATIVRANRAATDLFESQTELVGTHITAVLGDSVLTGEAQESDDIQITTKLDGESRHFTVRKTVLTDDYETQIGQLLVCRDVTEEIQREQQLEELNKRFDLLREETDTGVWSWDPDTDEMWWDSVSKQLFGYESSDCETPSAAFADQVPDTELEAIRKAHEKGENYRGVFRVNLPDGNHRWIHSRGILEYDANGDPEQWFGIQTDITEQKERERELQRQKERLDQFAGTISHDLRNPLMVAMARLEFIKDANSTEHVETIEQNLERMEQMIDETLTLAQTGQTIDDPDDVCLATVAEEAWMHSDIADCTFESAIPEMTNVAADRDRLLHVFENLFRNAADHNDPPLTIQTGILGDEELITDGGQEAGFYIEDNGSGIPEDRRNEIFDHGYTTNADGTGFGLSIVNDIVEAHGWHIDVTDGATGGARFEITGIQTEM